jgi:RNA 2',3'-cyclic 3'-phosphodiesterase
VCREKPVDALQLGSKFVQECAGFGRDYVKERAGSCVVTISLRREMSMSSLENLWRPIKSGCFFFVARKPIAMRLFVAIEISDEARLHLMQVQKTLQAAVQKSMIRWTDPAKVHLTLKFLGEVRDGDVPGVTGALAGIRMTTTSLLLRPTGLLFFPPRGPLRIVGAEMGGDVEALGALQARIEEACAELGLPRENRKYCPHLTIGRAKGEVGGRVRQDLTRNMEGLWPGPEFRAREFVLIESRPGRAGSEYTKLALFLIAS